MFGTKTKQRAEEDEILAKAEKIKAQRALEAKIKGFQQAEGVRIQWGKIAPHSHRYHGDGPFTGDVGTVWVAPDEIWEVVVRKIGTDAEREPGPRRR